MFQRHLGFTRDNCQALVERISPQTLEAKGILELTEIRKDIEACQKLKLQKSLKLRDNQLLHTSIEMKGNMKRDYRML